MNKRNALRLIAGSAGWVGIAATLGLGLSACSEQKQSFNAVDITGADYAKDFSLKDADGKVRTMADFKGKAVVMFFGYAQCPDVCPTTMTEMAQVKQQLGKATTAADLANRAAARTDQLSATTDGTQDEDDAGDDTP